MYVCVIIILLYTAPRTYSFFSRFHCNSHPSRVWHNFVFPFFSRFLIIMYRVIYITIHDVPTIIYTHMRQYFDDIPAYIYTIVPLDIPIHISAPMQRFLSHPIYVIFMCANTVTNYNIQNEYNNIQLVYRGYPTMSYEYSAAARLENKTKYIYQVLLFLRRG